MWNECGESSMGILEKWIDKLELNLEVHRWLDFLCFVTAPREGETEMNLERWKDKITADGGKARCIAESGAITLWKAYGKTDEARFYTVWNGDAYAYLSERRSKAKAVFDQLAGERQEGKMDE